MMEFIGYILLYLLTGYIGGIIAVRVFQLNPTREDDIDFVMASTLIWPIMITLSVFLVLTRFLLGNDK